MTEPEVSKPIDRYIPWMFVAFFIVVAAVNIVFIVLANQSHSGVVRKDAYRQGIAYNKVIAAAEAQAALGWEVEGGYRADQIYVTLNHSGRPLEGAVVNAMLSRPVADGSDQALALSHQGDGLYAAEIGDVAPGQWDLIADIVWQQQTYHWRKRLILP